ncbi:unnamed protein product [Callosobruchus maculatus]|uniref:Uncharacterized protein n=1 Tax=Callosobruchus maculatus TaxID=64391 RepID=A0A653C4E8_CALMS|nr:unnamed protein product [Callosobruchus maculatus]
MDVEHLDSTESGENKEDMVHSDTLELGELPNSEPNSDNEGIYDDIEDFDLGKEVDKLKAKNAELENHINKLVAAIEKQNATISDLKKTVANLEKNISSLYSTAKAELDRKNRQIADLQRELDDLKFRRKRPAYGYHFPPQKRARYDNDNEQSDNLGPVGQQNNVEGGKEHAQRASTRDKESLSLNQERVRNNDEADRRHATLDRADRKSDVGMNKHKELDNGPNTYQFKGSKKQDNYEETRGYREERYEGQNRKLGRTRENDTPDSEDRKSDDSNRVNELENRLGRDRGGNRLGRNWQDELQEERGYRERKHGEFIDERRDRNRHDHPKNRLGWRYQMEHNTYDERQYRDDPAGGRERERGRSRNFRRDGSRERGSNNDRDRGRSRHRRSRSVRSSSRESRYKNRNDPKKEEPADEMKPTVIEKQPEKTELKQEDHHCNVQVTKIVSRKKLKVVQKLEESMSRSPLKMLQNAKLNTSSDISTDKETHSKVSTPDEKKVLQKQSSDGKIRVLSNIVLSDSSHQKGEVTQSTSEEKPFDTKCSKESDDSDDLTQIQNFLNAEGLSFCVKKENKVSNRGTNESTATDNSKNKNDGLKKITFDAYKDRNQNSKCEKKHAEEKDGKNDSIQNSSSVEASSFCDKTENKVSNSGTTKTPVETHFETNLLPKSAAIDGDTKNKTESLNKVTSDTHTNQNTKCRKKHIEEKDKNKVSNSDATEISVAPDSESNLPEFEPNSTATDDDKKVKTDSLNKVTLDTHKDKNQNSKCKKKHIEAKNKNKVSNSDATEIPVASDSKSNLLEFEPKTTATDDDKKDKTDGLKKITLDAYKDRNQNSKSETKHVDKKTGKNNQNKVSKTKEDIQRDLEADGLIFRSTHSTSVVKETNDIHIEAVSETNGEANEDINRKEASVGLMLLGMKGGIKTATGYVPEGKSSRSNPENDIFGTDADQNDVIDRKEEAIVSTERGIEKDKQLGSHGSKTSKKHTTVIEKQDATKLQRKASTSKVNELNIEVDNRKKSSENIKEGGDENNSTSDAKINPRKKATGKPLHTNDLRAKIKSLFDESMDASDVSTNAKPEINSQNVIAEQNTKTNKINADHKTSVVQADLKQTGLQEIKNGKCKSVDRQTCQINSTDLVNKEDKKEVSKLRSSPRKKKTAEQELSSSSSQKRSRSKSTSRKSESDSVPTKKQKSKKTESDVRNNNKNKTECPKKLKAGFDKLNREIDAIAVAEKEKLSNKNIKADTKPEALKRVSSDENENTNEKQKGMCNVDVPKENVVITKNDDQKNPPMEVVQEKSDVTESKASLIRLNDGPEKPGNDSQGNPPVKVVVEKSGVAGCKASFSCLDNTPENPGSEVPKVSTHETTPENKKIITRKRITPTPVTDTKKPASFGDILKKCEGPVAAKPVKNLMVEQSLHLTHEGDIPLLHIEENHIDSLPNEDLRNPDSSLMRLIDTMTLSNMECEMPKTHDGNQGKEPEVVARTLSTELTFENLMYKVSSSPVHVTSAKSTENNDICNSNVDRSNVGDAVSTQPDGNHSTNVSSSSTNVVRNACETNVTSTITVNTSNGTSESTAKTPMKRKRRLVRLIISD